MRFFYKKKTIKNEIFSPNKIAFFYKKKTAHPIGNFKNKLVFVETFKLNCEKLIFNVLFKLHKNCFNKNTFLL